MCRQYAQSPKSTGKAGKQCKGVKRVRKRVQQVRQVRGITKSGFTFNIAAKHDKRPWHKVPRKWAGVAVKRRAL